MMEAGEERIVEDEGNKVYVCGTRWKNIGYLNVMGSGPLDRRFFSAVKILRLEIWGNRLKLDYFGTLL